MTLPGRLRSLVTQKAMPSAPRPLPSLPITRLNSASQSRIVKGYIRESINDGTIIQIIPMKGSRWVGRRIAGEMLEAAASDGDAPHGTKWHRAATACRSSSALHCQSRSHYHPSPNIGSLMEEGQV